MQNKALMAELESRGFEMLELATGLRDGDSIGNGVVGSFVFGRLTQLRVSVKRLWVQV